MPQETNLNVAPYFDDFDPQSNYYKVLFKPAYPVQARELNNLQSILQNQVEDMGQHLFKEGAKVIPGQLAYLDNYSAIQIEPDYLGIPVALYLDQLVGTLITGQQSGVTARVSSYITNEESERGNYTLYVSYFESSTTDASTSTFFDDEVLLTSENISFATTFIGANEGFAKALNVNANAIGSAFTLSSGVYFLRGHFVEVPTQILILDQYSNKPSYRIGLNVNESIVSSDEDPTLTDNAQGFNNFTAPGADRFKITASLQKKLPNDYDDRNFVQLSEVTNGLLREIKNITEYNTIAEELARRTFDESGHYYVRDFLTTTHNSLNNGFGNRGIYKSNQTTSQGNTPSDGLGIYKISPGKAYVRGFEVDMRGPTFLDFDKPRKTKAFKGRNTSFAFGPSFRVNRASSSPALGFDTSNFISLRDSRVEGDRSIASGKEIGVARFYDSALESGSYDSIVPDLNQWDVSLFDLNTYTELTLNTDTTLTAPVFIEGKSSGATAYLRHSISAGTALTAYCVTGDFFIGEKLEFDGVSENSRTAIDIHNYEISDIQSLYGSVGAAGTFSANIIPRPSILVGSVSITEDHNGISTVSAPGLVWPGIVTTGNLVQFSNPVYQFPNLAKVSQVNTNSIQIVGVETATNYRQGALPSTNINVRDFTVVKTKLENTSGGNTANNESLYSLMPKRNVESVDFTNSSLIIRKGFDVNITNNSTGAILADTNESFLPFDEERYTLIRSDGTFETLTKDKFNISENNSQLIINGLGSNDVGAKLTTSLRKSRVSAKVKTKKVAESVIVSGSTLEGSGTGDETLDDGLTYGNNPFGTRVQDKIISLSSPDVIMLYGVYESIGTEDPESPSMTTASLDGPNNTTNDLILGEQLVGLISGASARYIGKKSDTSVNFVYENTTRFENGEIVNFKTSGVSAIVANLALNGTNITKRFKLSSGQRDSFYDYSRVIRRDGETAPSRKIRFYFMSAEYDSSDTGDITVCNSYNNFDYGSEIPVFNGYRCTDMIDARPRVSRYSGGAGDRSPFEFFGRDFTGDQHSSSNVLASDEGITFDFNFFVGRMDRIYLNKEGLLTVKQGAPSENPALPDEVSGSMNIANVYLPPFLYSPSQARVQFIQHKRYQMSDIAKIELRVKNLEYYTSLNILESTTLNQFVPDANGLNRFKSGIFVDNFSDLEGQDTNIGIRNSIDRTNKVLRPPHFTTAISLQLGNTTIAGIGTTNAPNQDARFADNFGVNIKRTGQMVTLDYNEVSWLTQPFATRIESVTPFLVMFWEGSLKFEPDVDIWIDVNTMEVRDILQEGSFIGVSEALGAEVTTHADGSRSGITPVIWQSWETLGVDLNFDISTTEEAFSETTTSEANVSSAPEGSRLITTTTNDFLTTTTTTTTSVELQQQRTGQQQTIIEQIDTESLGYRVVSREVIQFMRARNIEFTCTRLKPFTQVYPFFDNVDVSAFCMNKVIEIEMVSGTFQVEETVTGVMPSTEDTENDEPTTSASITARVAQSNHKYGPYNSPTDRFEVNPYNRDESVPGTYSETSTILNIDTFSLASDDNPEFLGYVAPNMILRGTSSNAEARVTNVRLISDKLGTLIGNFRVPSSDDPSNPVFETGRSKLRLTSSPVDSRVGNNITTSAEEIFYSQGDIDNTQEVTLSLRNAKVTTNNTFVEEREFSDSVTVVEDPVTVLTGTESEQDLILPPAPPPIINNITNITQNITNVLPPPPPPPPRNPPRQDPLAQSFYVDDSDGIFLTSVDIFFQKVPVDESTPVVLQIREVDLGLPSEKILAYSELNKTPEEITISEDASIPTNFAFESPVYLNGKREYAIVLLSNSTEYTVWISRLGESDVSTLGTEEGQILVSSQPLLGSLFKSQNASSWTPSQYEDLTFKLYRADFVSSGTVQFFNSPSPSEYEVMRPDPISMESNTVRVGFGTTVTDSGLSVGNLITQENNQTFGRFVGYGGSATGPLTLTNVGTGFTPSSAFYTFTGVGLTALTGGGINATADITIENGVAIGATIVDGGKGYVIGDVLEPVSIGNLGLGEGMRLTVGNLYGQNQLIIDNVQGDFSTSAPDNIFYRNNSGVTTALNWPGPINPTEIETVTDGIHFNVFHRNHGLHATGNNVSISGIQPDSKPTFLTENYSITATTDIKLSNVSSPTNLSLFENLGVGLTNPGYVKIGSEVIKYTGVSDNTLTGITRGIDNTQIERHTVNNLVYKYEMNGVSLRRINKQHILSDSTSTTPITLDTYPLKINLSDTDYGTDRSGTSLRKLYFTQNKESGGPNGRATYNIPYEMMIPKINTMEPIGTNIRPSVRTVSGTSISGSEPSFIDQGFIDVANRQENFFEEPRIIANKQNEDLYLSELPGNKSLTMNLGLSSNDRRLSPAIDLNQTSIIFTSNRVNAPIEDYSSDFRVNSTGEDPNRFFYVTKGVSLENPASGIQVFVDAYVPTDSDLRAFYSVNQDGPVEDCIFVPFPGFGNFQPNGAIASQGDSNGNSDQKVPKVDVISPKPGFNLYREYKFTVDDLTSFKSFRIKLIGTSTNQAAVPMIRNFRVISLA